MNKKFWISIVIIFLQLNLALFFGAGLDESVKIPSHWNIKGEIDGYTDKWTGILLFPGINLIILLLMLFLPKFSVRYQNAPERFAKVIPTFTAILVFFFAVIHVYTILLAGNYVPNTSNFIFYALGLMIILLGNLLPKLPSSFFIGIRTPWSLSSEKNWRKTHKLGGFMFMLGGLLMLIIPTFWDSGSAIIVMFILFLICVLYPALYSFILYRRNKK